MEGPGSAGAAGAEVEAARESGAWSGPGGGVERAEWSGRARAARGASWVERTTCALSALFGALLNPAFPPNSLLQRLHRRLTQPPHPRPLEQRARRLHLLLRRLRCLLLSW